MRLDQLPRQLHCVVAVFVGFQHRKVARQDAHLGFGVEVGIGKYHLQLAVGFLDVALATVDVGQQHVGLRLVGIEAQGLFQRDHGLVDAVVSHEQFGQFEAEGQFGGFGDDEFLRLLNGFSDVVIP